MREFQARQDRIRREGGNPTEKAMPASVSASDLSGLANHSSADVVRSVVATCIRSFMNDERQTDARRFADYSRRLVAKTARADKRAKAEGVAFGPIAEVARSECSSPKSRISFPRPRVPRCCHHMRSREH